MTGHVQVAWEFRFCIKKQEIVEQKLKKIMVVLLINLFLYRFEIGFFDLKSMVLLQKKSKYVGVIGIFCKCHVVSRRSKEIAGMGAMTAL